MNNRTPTLQAYGELQRAYDAFNGALFDGRLPPCVITYQRRRRTYGYFCAEIWHDGGEQFTDEIALNPQHFLTRTVPEILSTLVHEMVHLDQHHFGAPGRRGYHNRQWADWMERVGLIPSATGQPGGKRTGEKMTHYIEAGGRFDVACAELLGQGFDLSWADRTGESSRARPKPTRSKYTCPGCESSVWAKPGLGIGCLPCAEPFVERAA